VSVFVDTNVFVAAADPSETRGDRARHVLKQLTSEDAITTELVVIETWWLLRKRLNWHDAERWFAGLRGTPVRVEHVLPSDMERAAWIGERWSDQRFDLVDKTSMAVMERLGCSRVATFDRDFAVYRYGPDRRLAFEIVT
jgi:predicted nucleic acid-binding protein